MKKCGSCKEEKTLDSFPSNISNKDGLNKKCKNCYNEYMKKYYNKNREKHLRLVAINNKQKIQEIKSSIYEYLLKNPCVDCGESNPIVLEFDHINTQSKSDSISNMIRKRYSIDRIMQEILKCEVRCANCHRIRTAKQFNWYKHK